MQKKKKSSRCFESQAIYDLLESCEMGDTITYTQMTEESGIQPQTAKCRSYVRSCLDAVQKEKGFVFECVESVGYIRLNDSEIAGVVPIKNRKRIETVSRRAIAKLECVNADTLELNARQQLWLEISSIGVIGTIASQSAMKKFKQAQDQAVGKTLSLKEMIGSLAC